MTAYERIREQQAIWEAEHGRRAERVYVPVGTCTIPTVNTAHAVFVPSPRFEGAVGFMHWIDWYEDPMLQGEAVRFE
jgi:hypothetical protein